MLKSKKKINNKNKSKKYIYTDEAKRIIKQIKDFTPFYISNADFKLYKKPI
jgi:hypothetical protein